MRKNTAIILVLISILIGLIGCSQKDEDLVLDYDANVEINKDKETIADNIDEKKEKQEEEQKEEQEEEQEELEIEDTNKKDENMDKGFETKEPEEKTIDKKEEQPNKEKTKKEEPTKEILKEQKPKNESKPGEYPIFTSHDPKDRIIDPRIDVPSKLPSGAKLTSRVAYGDYQMTEDMVSRGFEEHVYSYENSFLDGGYVEKFWILWRNGSSAPKTGMSGKDEDGKSFVCSVDTDERRVHYTIFDESQIPKFSGGQQNEIINVSLDFLKSYGY